MAEKKPNFFKKHWDKLPRKTRLWIVGGTCAALSFVPFSSPLQVVCLVYIARNSERGRKFVEKLGKYFPKTAKLILGKAQSSSETVKTKDATIATKPVKALDKSDVTNKIMNNKARYFKQHSVVPKLNITKLAVFKRAFNRD